MSGKMQFISRTGTGSCSSSSPCSLTFKFAPSVVIPVLGQNGSTNSMLHSDVSNSFFYGSNTRLLTTSFVQGGGAGTSAGVMQRSTSGSGTWYAYAKKSSDGKTIYWYYDSSNGSEAKVYNANGTKECFLAFA